ncbi:MAG TPA: autotransporter outer membrane beta-barrel domain-containing protein [Pararobbsia sp.]|nr:autotransporter outer membrane beta-barrel domain-containing protein [Pararobbsia sp.]
MNHTSTGRSGARLPYQAALVTPARSAAMVAAAVLPWIGTPVHAATCDNQVVPGATCATTVSAGNTVNGTIVNAAGVQALKGGTANLTTINSGGSQTVSSGGLATSTNVNGGTQIVRSAGSATSTTVNNGGIMYVSSGGIATNTNVMSGGSFGVSNGGLSIAAVVNDGGLQRVYSGGSAVSNVVNDGGIMYVSAGGAATGTTVNSGGSMGVSKGGLGTSTVVNSGGLMRVYSGGSAASTLVAGGKQYVSAGGTSVDTVVSAGSQVVFTGGVANATVVNSGGTQLVSSGGTAVSSVVQNGGTQTVELGGTISGGTVDAGASLTVHAGGQTAAGLAAAQTIDGLSIAGSLRVIDASADALTGAAAASFTHMTLNGGAVIFGDLGTGGYKTMTIAGLSGSGQFTFNTNVGAGTSDKLVLSNASGNYTISIHDQSSAPPTSATERLALITETNSTAMFSLAGGAIDVGAYKFGVDQSGGDVYLFNTGTRSDIAAVASAAAGVPAQLSNIELSQVVSRLEEFRSGDTQGGLWIRAYDQQLRMTPDGTPTQVDLYGVQVGRDWRFPTALGVWHAGATGGYAQADQTFGDIGGATMRPWNIGAYGSLDLANGVFADAVARYTSFKQNLTVTTAANYAQASYAQNGYSLALDGGKRFALSQRWWFEPRIGINDQRGGEVGYQTTLGTSVDVPATNSLFGTVEARLGGTWRFDDRRIDPYVGVMETHVFDNHLSVTVGGTPLDVESLPSSWVSAVAGVDAALTRHVRASATFSYGTGHGYTQPWAVSLGVAYVN